jgi:predicted RNA binding protein YcfA (HicA-like mRNA interferase family)
VPKVREAIKLIETDGWWEVTTKGQPSDDLAPGTYNSIRKQAGLKG